MDASSVSSSATRASMLERQRQVALRRRRNQMQSASIIRTSDSSLSFHNAPSEDGRVRAHTMNHPVHVQQQVHQTNLAFSPSMQHSFPTDGLAFGQNNAMLPTQFIPVNSFPYQTEQIMVSYHNNQGQSYHRNSRYSNASDLANSQRMVQYKPSGDDMSELTDTRVEEQQPLKNEPTRYVSMEEDERSSHRRSTFSFIDIEEGQNRLNSSTSRPSSKLRRSTSSRSLSFDDNPDEQQRRSYLPPSHASRMSIDEVSREESEKRITYYLREMKSIKELDTDNPSMMRAFLTKPCPKGVGMLKCYIKRNKGIKNRLFPEYRVYLKETDAFLMTSKKRIGNTTSNYLISMGRNDFRNRQSPNVLGKLRSNFLGTEYTIYDGGRNPQYENTFEEDGDADVRCELGAILYAASTSLGAKGPRKIKACIGKLDGDDNPTLVWRPMNEDDDRMVSCFKEKGSAQDNLVSFVNKKPSWNEDIKAYALNFNGRVTEASVKNFQLADESDEGKIYLQFGRTGKDEFILDLQWPLSPLQAFAFALSSFDSKLASD